MRTVWVVAAIGVGICAMVWQSSWLIRGRSGAHYTSEDEARRYKAAKSVLMHSAVSGDRASLHKAITAVPSVVNAQVCTDLPHACPPAHSSYPALTHPMRSTHGAQ